MRILDKIKELCETVLLAVITIIAVIMTVLLLLILWDMVLHLYK